VTRSLAPPHEMKRHDFLCVRAATTKAVATRPHWRFSSSVPLSRSAETTTSSNSSQHTKQPKGQIGGARTHTTGITGRLGRVINLATEEHRTNPLLQKDWRERGCRCKTPGQGKLQTCDLFRKRGRSGLSRPLGLDANVFCPFARAPIGRAVDRSLRPWRRRPRLALR